MSFLSIFKAIGKGLVVTEHVAAPIVSTAFPQFAPWINKIDTLFGTTQAAIIQVEQNNPAGEGQLKQAQTVDAFEAGLAEMQSILALSNKHLEYDDGKLKEAINAQVDAYNKFAAVKASFKVVEGPKP